MKTLLVSILACLPVFAADQAPPELVAVKAACGPGDVEFNVKSGKVQPPALQPEPGKGLVYVVEEYDGPPVKPTVKVGLDGAWVGANRGTSYMSFPIEPGEHHLCAEWQIGRTLSPISRTVSLTSLKVEAGQTYYLRARFLLVGRNFPYRLDFDKIDSDQGRLLVGTSPLSAYQAKK